MLIDGFKDIPQTWKAKNHTAIGSTKLLWDLQTFFLYNACVEQMQAVLVCAVGENVWAVCLLICIVKIQEPCLNKKLSDDSFPTLYCAADMDKPHGS